MTRKTLIIGGASGIGFAVGSLLAGRGEEIILAGRDGAKLDAARQRLSAHAASVHTFVLDISREAEILALGETLGEVNNIVVTAVHRLREGFFPGWISARQGWPLIQNSGEASMLPAISAGTSPPAVR
ncbi:SDR family NAD(P)-dependent oxidoreductase [Enterobacter asburiae]|uniref:SDR family NAD(P)-dependent oxidoreductase n=1 Tax=Enterobacter asburiae TaxID=61645 RepID=UPI000B2A0249|nr:SDR family NAD(P)-dependent oxidoreductase [Enterobacter asburiae]